MTLRARFDGHRPARRGVEVDLVTTVLRGDEAVWEGRTRFLSRAAPGDGVDRPVDEVEVGAAGVEETWELGADLGRRYAAVAGDRNPIHQYAWSARLFGFERAIIHGMWTVGRVVAASPDAPRVVETTFRRPIFLPGTARAVIDADGAFAVTADRGDRPSVVGRLR